jgi:hypothetical protein
MQVNRIFSFSPLKGDVKVAQAWMKAIQAAKPLESSGISCRFIAQAPDFYIFAQNIAFCVRACKYAYTISYYFLSV